MTVDEETPLLGSQHVKHKRTPLPWFQFSIILFLQLAEPLTSQVISPFAPQLIRDIGITNGDETQVGYYVGIMFSLFFLTQACTVLHWSRLSDIVGRKPVILMGLFGLSLSMFCFGLSKTFWGLVLSRCLNGALNGNIGVIKSVMAEMTDTTNISQAYAYLPIAWSTGSVLGPMIGGALSRPVERFPNLFSTSTFLKEYPYFLPCAVPAAFSAFAWFVTYMFLKETHSHPISIWKYLGLGSNAEKKQKMIKTAPGDEDDIPEEEKPYTLRRLLIPSVILAGGNYCMVSLVDIAYRAVLPLFLSTPVELGGLGLAPPAIGNILSLYGFFNGIVQVFFFANIHDYLGSKKTFTVGMLSGFPLFACFPLLNWLAKTQGVGYWVWSVLALQTTVSIALSFSYGAIFIYIAAASPNRASLGATNGLCQMSVSVFRAIGPAAANSLFSWSISEELMGGWFVYYVLLLVVGLSVFTASLLPQQIGNLK